MFHVVHDYPTVGLGWNAAAQAITDPGDYIQLACDDYLWHKGWDLAAVECVDSGSSPSPLMLHPNGTTRFAGRHTSPDGRPIMSSSAPFLSWDWWNQIGGRTLDTHYASDDWVSWALDYYGVPTTYCEGYAVTEIQTRNGGWRFNTSEHNRRVDDGRESKSLWKEWKAQNDERHATNHSGDTVSA